VRESFGGGAADAGAENPATAATHASVIMPASRQRFRRPPWRGAVNDTVSTVEVAGSDMPILLNRGDPDAVSLSHYRPARSDR
jgi:hypothetical protein